MFSYTVTLERTASGWRATCATLPQCYGEGKNQKAAYMAIKESIRQHLRKCLQEGKPIPKDRTTTKFFRVDVEALKDEFRLR